MSANIDANQRSKIVVVQVFLIVCSLTAIVLRFLSKRISHTGLGWDDCTILIALVRTSRSAAEICL